MTVEISTTLLGKPATAPEVQALLKQAGAKDPKLKRGDVNANVVLEKLGLELVFTDEAFHTRNDDLEIGKGQLFLTSVELVAPGHRKSPGFQGPLPRGADFRQDRAQLRALLGPPEVSDDDLALDRWRIDDTWYFARYTDEFDRVLTFSFQIPDPD